MTLEDVIEELVGEIWDEHDAIAAESFHKSGEDTYRVFCSTDLDDLFDFFHISCETEASTINGWIIENLDRIPEPGDAFEYEGLLFTVSRVENNRAVEIEVKGEPLPEPGEEDAV